MYYAIGSFRGGSRSDVIGIFFDESVCENRVVGIRIGYFSVLGSNGFSFGVRNGFAAS